MMYPIMVNLDGKTVVVIGAGAVAERRILGLVGTGARIRVVAATATDKVRALAASDQILLHERLFEESDLDDAFLAIAATDDPAVNSAVTRIASARQLMVCCVNSPGDGSYITPAVVRRGDLTIALATGGDSATLTSVLKDRIESAFGPEWELWTQLFAIMRPAIQSLPSKILRKAAIERVLDDPSTASLIKLGQLPEAEASARKCI